VYIARMPETNRSPTTVYLVGARPVCPGEIEAYRRQSVAGAAQWVDVGRAVDRAPVKSQREST